MAWMAVGWPCGVCGGGVGGDTMHCASCHRWVHRGVMVSGGMCRMMG